MSNRYPVKHSDGTLDRRYTIDLEYCGYEEQKHVLRFCGEWISCSMKYKHAVENAELYRDRRGL